MVSESCIGSLSRPSSLSYVRTGSDTTFGASRLQEDDPIEMWQSTARPAPKFSDISGTNYGGGDVRHSSVSYTYQGKDPLIPLAPSIYASITIDIYADTRSRTGTAYVSGEHTKFPFHEVYFRDAKTGEYRWVYTHSPAILWPSFLSFFQLFEKTQFSSSFKFEW